MTPAYLNFSPSSSSTSADHQAASSCSYLTTRNFFDLACNQDQSEKYIQDFQQPQFQHNLADNYLASSHGGSFDIENDSDNGLKFSIWKKEEKYENQETSTDYEFKWMSPKMRWMNMMKKDHRDSPTASTANYALIKSSHEDQKQKPSSLALETENTSNISSNSMISSPIRTCSDCNTTKTPLWRSGPRGPKSLCNACGIRQRKARRAMAAAAAAAANDTAFEKETTPPLVIKTKKHNNLKIKTKQQKDKTSDRVAKFKKRSCNLMIDGTEDDNEAQKKVCLEEFLETLTNKLAYDQVFPQDEKDAAILLMAMSLHHAHPQ